MIIMNLKVNNFYEFNNFNINFSYPRKIKDSTVPNEFLIEKPNFRFKRINVIMGANASGKTIFGKILMNIFHFIESKNKLELVKAISDKKEIAEFEIDLVLEDLNLYRIKCQFIEDDIKKLEILKATIAKTDSYEGAVKKLQLLSDLASVKEEDIDLSTAKVLNSIKAVYSDWFFSFPGETKNFKYNIKILNIILKSFDPSISKVEESKEVENTYHIVFNSGKKVIVQDGEIKTNYLSKGTEEGIEIANIIYSMLRKDRPYFIDEKISYVHSELELEILNQMINILTSKSQLFFTTHNIDILEMNLPIHSFTLFKKDPSIEVVYPSDYLKRNDRTIVNAIKNDVFNTLPNTSLLDELDGVLDEYKG